MYRHLSDEMWRLILIRTGLNFLVIRIVTLFVFLVGVLLGPVCASAKPLVPADDAFWQHWGDGRAEMSSYELTIRRYGQLRSGTAVAIFVTETFDGASRVKTERPTADNPRSFPVMKLNLVQDFPTGIYDYNLMTSVFATLTSARGQPAGFVSKASFSSQEWCGHVYQQAIFDRDKVRMALHSYFEGEADQEFHIQIPPGEYLCEDSLLLWARGFTGPALEQGQTATIPILRSMQVCRLNHIPPAWDQAMITRSTKTRSIKVPAGEFKVETWTVDIQPKAHPRRRWTIEVEHAHPRRVIRWSTDDGQRAQLLGSDRLQYWKMHDNGQESQLGKIGLTPDRRSGQALQP